MPRHEVSEVVCLSGVGASVVLGCYTIFKGLRPMPPTPSASGVCMGAGCKAAGCKAAGLQAAELQAAGLKAARVALQAAGLQVARVALQAAGWTWAVCAKGRKRCTVAF